MKRDYIINLAVMLLMAAVLLIINILLSPILILKQLMIAIWQQD